MSSRLTTSPSPTRSLPGALAGVSSELQAAQAALRATLRQARRGCELPISAEREIAASVRRAPDAAPPRTPACPVLSDDLVLWLGDRGRARKLGKAMRVILLRLAEPRVRLRITLIHRLLASIRPARSTKLDSDLRVGLLPLIRRMRVDFRHVHDLRSESDEERCFIVTVLTRHAVKSLGQLSADEMDRVMRTLNSGRGLLDIALDAMRQRLAEVAGDRRVPETEREASLGRSMQGIQAINCVKEALKAALAPSSSPEGGCAA